MFGGDDGSEPGLPVGLEGPDHRPTGYVVEIRIPFKSLRYPGSGAAALGHQRHPQGPAHRATRTPGPTCKRANASFLAQAGAIDGLHDMQRGVVTEIQPFVTAAANGALRADGDFVRGTGGS